MAFSWSSGAGICFSTEGFGPARRWFAYTLSILPEHVSCRIEMYRGRTTCSQSSWKAEHFTGASGPRKDGVHTDGQWALGSQGFLWCFRLHFSTELGRFQIIEAVSLSLQVMISVLYKLSFFFMEYSKPLRSDGTSPPGYLSFQPGLFTWDVAAS